MPTIADVLAAEFLAAGGDIERGRDRATMRRVEKDLRAVSYWVEHAFDRLLSHIVTEETGGRSVAASAALAPARAYELHIIACQQAEARGLNRSQISDCPPVAAARPPTTPLVAAGTASAPELPR